MSCSPFDLRDYFLKELPESEQRQVEAHVRNCQPCFEELDRLRVTEAALFALREEEIPQRIGFVSDKISNRRPGGAGGPRCGDPPRGWPSPRRPCFPSRFWSPRCARRGRSPFGPALRR